MEPPRTSGHPPTAPPSDHSAPSSSTTCVPSSSSVLLSSPPPHPAHVPSQPSSSATAPPTSDGTLYDSPKSLRILPHPAPPSLSIDYRDPEKGSLKSINPNGPPDTVTDADLPPSSSGPSCKAERAVKGRKKRRSDSTIVMTPWQPWRRRLGWSEWMGDTVSTPNMVPALVVQAFSTGILDATTYADFSVFASNQTGNAIILTVGFIDDLPILSKLTGASFGSFLLGALIFGQLGHFTGTRRRAWLLFHVFAQAIILAIAAFLVSPAGPRHTQIRHRNDWIVIALFAFMSGAQVAMARQSGSQELPTAPMTSTLVDLMADRNLLVWFSHKDAGPRNRRLAYVVAMIVGAVLGACIHLYAGSWEVVVVAIFLKVVVFAQLALAGAQKDT